MKEVDVPLVDQNSCQNQLRTTRLGLNFVLDSTSFVCAGGEAGKGNASRNFSSRSFLIHFSFPDAVIFKPYAVDVNKISFKILL